MGSFISSSMEQSMKKNQEALRKMNQIQMEKQKLLQYEMQKKQMAMQIAKSRDTCHWITAFYATIGTGLLAGFRKTKRPALLAPLVPLSFPTLYFWDLAYGNKIRRIKYETDSILEHEVDILELVLGVPPQPSISLESK